MNTSDSEMTNMEVEPDTGTAGSSDSELHDLDSDNADHELMEESPNTGSALEDVTEDVLHSGSGGHQESEEEAVSVNPESATDEEEMRLLESVESSAKDLEQSESDVAVYRREREKLRARRWRTERRLESVEAKLETYRRAQESLGEWVSARSRSFAWRLLEALKNEDETLRKEWNHLVQALEAPISVASESPSRIQDRFMMAVATTFAIVAAIFTAVTGLKYGRPELQTWESVVNPFYWPTWVLGIVCVAIFMVIWFILLIIYYRRTSERRYRLRVARSHVDGLVGTVESMRAEKQRLTALHSQVPDYLRYLSEVVNRPWALPVLAAESTQPRDEIQRAQQATVSAERIVFDSDSPDPRYLPSYFRLASVPELTGDAKEMALVRDALHHLLNPGWRTNALHGLVGQVEEALSLPKGSLDPSRLDRNPGLRETLLTALAETSAREKAGLEVLRNLAHQIQEVVLDEVHPPVRSIGKDPLDGLALSDDVLEPVTRGPVDWDVFLTQAMGAGSAWSPAPFTSSGRRSIPAVHSVGFGAERLAPEVSREIAYHAISSKTARPIDMAVRIDRTLNPLPPEFLAALTQVERQDDLLPNSKDEEGSNDHASEHL